MDKIQIVGIRGVSFDDEKTGRTVNGTTFFYLMEDDHTSGKLAGKLFISAQLCDSLDYVPNVGDECWVIYNRYGKPAKFEKIGK